MWPVVLPCTRWPGFPAMAFAAVAVACGTSAAHVTISPLGGMCARPMGANLVKVTSYAASGEHNESVALDETLAIASFPADTEQIGVEVLIGGGEIGAAGKSAPLVFDSLADGTTIPVFMAPPDGFCEVGGMTEARAQPLVARAGAGVLVVGGIGPAGPLSTAEYYDPVTATFSSVAVPQVLTEDPQGFTGAALATLPDGKVALSGGPHNAVVVFDPEVRAFTTDPALIESRAFHAALAVGDQDVVLAGGSSGVSGLSHSGLPRRQVQLYHLNKIGAPDPKALLPTTNNLRIDARLFDLGIQLDGQRRYLLAGGTGDPGLSDRFTLDPDVNTTTLPGGFVQAVALDGGAVLTAFGDDAAASASGAVSVYAPDALAARPTTKAAADQFVRLIALEDGRVAAFGGQPMAGDPMGRVQIYDPTRDAWASGSMTSSGPGPLTSPSLVRLADGTVLVLGGAVSPRAWIYRPSLVGPASGSVTVAPTSETNRGVLTAPDPGTVMRVLSPSPAWILTAPGDALTARALVGGPRMAIGSVGATVHVGAGGVALIAQQLGPGQAIVAELMPGQPPRLVQLDAGGEHQVCSQPPALLAFDPAAPVTLRLSISDHDARLSLGGGEILACGIVATDRGSWGLAALGAGAQVAVDSVTVER